LGEKAERAEALAQAGQKREEEEEEKEKECRWYLKERNARSRADSS
jgi:hypothetical protein